MDIHEIPLLKSSTNTIDLYLLFIYFYSRLIDSNQNPELPMIHPATFILHKKESFRLPGIQPCIKRNYNIIVSPAENGGVEKFNIENLLFVRRLVSNLLLF